VFFLLKIIIIQTFIRRAMSTLEAESDVAHHKFATVHKFHNDESKSAKCQQYVLACFCCKPWLQIRSSRSHRLAIRVFSSTPTTVSSPCPKSTASCPIFCTSIRFVCKTQTSRHHISLSQIKFKTTFNLCENNYL